MVLRLAYDQKGEGPRTLVLLHGFTGGKEAFAAVEPYLLPCFRLVRVDLPGHGASPLPAASGQAGFEATLGALERVIDEVGAQEVDLCGYSQGARVALGFSLRAQGRVGRLVLESGTAGLRRRAARRERRLADAQLAQELLRDGVDRFIGRWEALPLFEGLQRLPKDAQEALRRRRAACSAQGLAGALGCLGLGVQPDYWTRLWRLLRPTLLLTGALDPKFTELSRQMAAELPLAWSHALEGVGHAPHLEAPGRWAQEVVPFLRTPWPQVTAHEPLHP